MRQWTDDMSKSYILVLYGFLISTLLFRSCLNFSFSQLQSRLVTHVRMVEYTSLSAMRDLNVSVLRGILGRHVRRSTTVTGIHVNIVEGVPSQQNLLITNVSVASCGAENTANVSIE